MKRKPPSKSNIGGFLLLRLLAFAAIILAFAQPKLVSMEGNGISGTGGHAVSLFVDNSLSMEGMGEEGQLLQSAKNKASLVVNQYKPTDQFQVLTNAFSGRDQTFLTKDQALERIESIRIDPNTQPLPAVLQRVSNQLIKADDRQQTAYLFTDLQKSTHQLTDDIAVPDSAIQWLFVPENCRQYSQYLGRLRMVHRAYADQRTSSRVASALAP